MKVSCYYNIRKECFSVKQGKLPIQHFSSVLLKDCKFHVNEAGRQKVLRELRKNVHSYIKGEMLTNNKNSSLTTCALSKLTDEIRVRYNPYLYPYFFEAISQKEIKSCKLCLLYDKKVYILCR